MLKLGDICVLICDHVMWNAKEKCSVSSFSVLVDLQPDFFSFQLEFKKGQKSLEEKRIEKLLKKHAKEIYKLRKTKSIKGQLDVQSFK